MKVQAMCRSAMVMCLLVAACDEGDRGPQQGQADVEVHNEPDIGNDNGGTAGHAEDADSGEQEPTDATGHDALDVDDGYGGSDGGDGGTGDGGGNDSGDGGGNDSGDGGGMCHSDYPCFGRLARCSADGRELIHMVDLDCHVACGPGPCSGSYCSEGERESCGEDAACVNLEMGDSGDLGAECRPLVELCGGPNGRSCDEGAHCEMAASHGGGPCATLLAGGYGVCRPLDACVAEGPSCGCSVGGDGELVYTSYENDCQRRAAGDALFYEDACSE